MMDVLTNKQRSYCMSQIKSQNTKPELMFRKLLRSSGIKGFRRGMSLLGNPDFIIPEKKTAIFIDGCFWHKCPRCYVQPKSNKGVLKRVGAAKGGYWEIKK